MYLSAALLADHRQRCNDRLRRRKRRQLWKQWGTLFSIPNCQCTLPVLLLVVTELLLAPDVHSKTMVPLEAPAGSNTEVI